MLDQRSVDEIERWIRARGWEHHEAPVFIEPLFNRCLIMEVDDVAFHGYSSVRMPEDVTRKSLACWYFSPERGARQRETHHDVAFQLRPRDGPQARVRHYAHRAASWYRNVDQSLRKGIL